MKNRINGIELLRIVLCLVVLLAHTTYITGQTVLNGNFFHSSLAVEFFYILNGYFLFFKGKDENLDIKQYCINLIIKLSPVIIFVTLLHCFLYNVHLINETFFRRNEFLNILFIRDIGTNSFGLIPKSQDGFWSTNTHLWYLGPLFYASLLYFYLQKTNKENKFIFITILISYIGFVEYSYLGKIKELHYLIRGLFSIGFGIIFAGLTYKLDKEKINNICNRNYLTKVVILFIELLICTDLYKVLFKKFYTPNILMYFYIIFALLVFDFILNNNLLAKTINKINFSKISKYTYCLYATQWIPQVLLANNNFIASTSYYKNFRTNYPVLELLFSFAVIVGFAIFTHNFIEKPSYKYLSTKLKKNENR